MECPRLCIIGAGNVGSHLYRWLTLRNISVPRVISRADWHPHIPGEVLSHNISDIPDDTDICVLALPDDALPGFIRSVNDKKRIWVHTSGTHPMDILASSFPQHGVFYPLQTFSRDVDMIYDDIPVLIEASGPSVFTSLETLGKLISERVVLMDSAHRKALHIGAVFACNFSNHMMSASEEILGNAGIPFNLLAPLLRQTVGKAISKGPSLSQTGPAARNDLQVMEEHLHYLEGFPEWQRLYSILSNSIRNRQNQQGDDN